MPLDGRGPSVDSAQQVPDLARSIFWVLMYFWRLGARNGAGTRWTSRGPGIPGVTRKNSGCNGAPASCFCVPRAVTLFGLFHDWPWPLPLFVLFIHIKSDGRFFSFVSFYKLLEKNARSRQKSFSPPNKTLERVDGTPPQQTTGTDVRQHFVTTRDGGREGFRRWFLIVHQRREGVRVERQSGEPFFGKFTYFHYFHGYSFGF